MKVALVAIFGSWPVTWYPPGELPETAEQRRARLTMAADVVTFVAHDNPTGLDAFDSAPLVTVIWGSESAMEYHVHAGTKSPIGHQDHGKARCLGQLRTWKGNTLLTPEQFKALPGTSPEATERCARATLSYLHYHARRCLIYSAPPPYRPRRNFHEPLSEHEVGIIFASYAMGYCTQPLERSAKRAAKWAKMRKALLASVDE